MKGFFWILAASALTMAFVRPASGPLPEGERLEEAIEETVEETAGVPRSGLRVFVDPETGELVGEPTEEQLERLRIETSRQIRERRSSWDLRQFGLRGGGQGVFLDGWADHQLVVRRAEDGSLRTVCSQRDMNGHTGHDGN
ncbi:MAG: hypothetical protein OES47_01455 [Acidobacteriota bacterium]|nr:hypothetical protein [Acidobacteriota bacterium]